MKDENIMSDGIMSDGIMYNGAEIDSVSLSPDLSTPDLTAQWEGNKGGSDSRRKITPEPPRELDPALYGKTIVEEYDRITRMEQLVADLLNDWVSRLLDEEGTKDFILDWAITLTGENLKNRKDKDPARRTLTLRTPKGRQCGL